MNVKYYSPDPENMFEHAYHPIKFVFDDKGNLLNAYECDPMVMKWDSIPYISTAWIKQYLHNYCFRELTDEEVFLANL